MHLFISLAVDLDVDHHRRERARDRRRGDQNGLDQVQSSRVAAPGDLADVPDDRPARVEVRGADQKDPALGVLGGDRIEQRLVVREQEELRASRSGSRSAGCPISLRVNEACVKFSIALPLNMAAPLSNENGARSYLGRRRCSALPDFSKQCCRLSLSCLRSRSAWALEFGVDDHPRAGRRSSAGRHASGCSRRLGVTTRRASDVETHCA
jgi:hypothetical protein